MDELQALLLLVGTARAALLIFASSSETEIALVSIRAASHPQNRVATAFSAKLLSWGFPKIASPPASNRTSAASYGPGWLPIHRREGATLRARSVLAVPPGFDGFLRAAFAGLLHPATGHEVRPVSDLYLSASIAERTLVPAKKKMLQVFPDGVVHAHTLQSFPLVARRTASPRPLPSRRFPALRPTRPQGLARSTNPLSCTGVATSRDPMLSWVFLPFRVLPTRSACESHAM